MALSPTHTCMLTDAAINSEDPRNTISWDQSARPYGRGPGRIICWGANRGVQRNLDFVPASLSSTQWFGLAAGGNATVQLTCAMSLSGQIACWGSTTDGRDLSMVPPTYLVASSVLVSSGGSFACAIAVSGSVACWDPTGNVPRNFSDWDGPIGNRTTTNGLVAGRAHVCGLLSDGVVRCACVNPGFCGEAATVPPALRSPRQTGGSPVSSLANSPVLNLAAGPNATCAVFFNGTATCWGAIADGSARLPTTAQGNFLPGNILRLAIGNGFACALLLPTGPDTNHRVACWGAGNASTTPAASPPAHLTDGSVDVAGLYAGGDHACAVEDVTGRATCWGANQFGQALVPGSVNVTAMALQAHNMGSDAWCLITSTSPTNGSSGSQFFEGGRASVPRPGSPTSGRYLVCGGGVTPGLVPVPLFRAIGAQTWVPLALSVSSQAICVVNGTPGGLWCWGSNEANGQLSPPSEIAFPPFGSPASEDLVATAVAVEHTCVLTRGGRAVCYSSAGNNTGIGYSSIAAGAGYMCGIQGGGSTGGTVVCTTLLPETADSVVSQIPAGGDDETLEISSGRAHVCTQRTRGRVECWGIGLPATLPASLQGSYAAVSAGQWHTCASLIGGGAVCVGRNLTPPPASILIPRALNATLGGALVLRSVHSGAQHTCAVTTSGCLVCWGAVYIPCDVAPVKTAVVARVPGVCDVAPSALPTPSPTPTVSLTATGTRPASPSSTTSGTATGTAAATRTATASATATGTSSGTATAGASLSGSLTPTGTSSGTATVTSTSSGTATASGTSSGTATGSATPSGSPRARCDLRALLASVSRPSVTGSLPPVVGSCTGPGLSGSNGTSQLVEDGVRCRLACPPVSAVPSSAYASTDPQATALPAAVVQWGPGSFACDVTAPAGNVWRSIPADNPPGNASSANASALAPIYCVPVITQLNVSSSDADTCGDLGRVEWAAPGLRQITAQTLRAAGIISAPYTVTTGGLVNGAGLVASLRPWGVAGSDYRPEALGQFDALQRALLSPLGSYRVDAHLAVNASSPCYAAASSTGPIPGRLATVVGLLSASSSTEEAVFRLDTLVSQLASRAGLASGVSTGIITVPTSGGGTCSEPRLSVWLQVVPMQAPNASFAPTLAGDIIVNASSASGMAFASGPVQQCAIVDLVLSSPLGASAPIDRASPAAGSDRGTLILTDALPPLSLSLLLPENVGVGERLSVSCASSAPHLAVVSPASITLGRGDTPLPFTVSPVFQGSNELSGSVVSLRVSCAVSSTHAADAFPAYAPFSTRSLPLAYAYASWPLLRNALVQYSIGNDTHPGTQKWVLDPSLPFQPRQASPATAQAAPFEIVLNKATNVTLYGDGLYWLSAGPHFSARTRVLVGSHPCEMLDVAADGSWARFTTPSYETACGSATTQRPCTHRLTVQNPLNLTSAAAIAAGSGSTSAVIDLSLSMSCPPFCPDGVLGNVSARPLPYAVVSNGSIVQLPSTTQSVSGGFRVAALSDGGGVSSGPGGLQSSTGYGVQYVQECQGDYVSPLDPSGACRNESDSNSYRCAWGQGKDCKPCPINAVCPGGYRQWPRPGHYSPGETSAIVTCQPPALKRCARWDPALGAVQCGEGYRQGSVGCSSCADKYFPTLDGACDRCPSPGDPRPVVVAVVVLLIVLLAVAGTVTGLSYLMIRSLGGGSIGGALKRSLDLMVWLFTVVQVQVAVGKAASTGLPDWLRAFYALLNVFNFEPYGFHPSCISGSDGPFLSIIVLFSATIALLVAQLALHVNYRRLCGLDHCGLGRKRSAELLPPGERPTSLRLTPEQRVMLAHAAALRSADRSASPGFTRAGSTVAYANPLSLAQEAEGHDPAAGRLRRFASSLRTTTTRLARTASRRLVQRRRAAVSAREAAIRALPTAQRWGARADSAKPLLRRLVFMLLTLLYPSVTSGVMSNLHCETRRVTVAVYRTMGGDGSTLRVLGIPVDAPTVNLSDPASLALYLQGRADPNAATEIDVSVLHRDPFLVCMEGSHRGVAGLSIALLVLFVIGYPFGTLLYLRKRVREYVIDVPRTAGGGGLNAASAAIAQAQRYAGAEESDSHRQWAYVMDAKGGLVKAYRTAAVLLCCAGKRYTGSMGKRRRAVADLAGGPGGGGAGVTARIAAASRRVLFLSNPMANAAHPGQVGAQTVGIGGTVVARANPAALALPGTISAPNSARASDGLPASGDEKAVTTADDVVDACPSLVMDHSLSHWTGSDYRPSRYWFRHVELALLFCLNAIIELYPSDRDRYGSALLVWTALAVAIGYYLAQEPFRRGDYWKHVAKISHLCLMVTITGLNLATLLVNAHQLKGGFARAPTPAGDAPLSPCETGQNYANVDLELFNLCATRQALAVATFAFSMLFFVVLIGGFVWSLYEGIDAEVTADKQAAIEAYGHAATTPGAGAGAPGGSPPPLDWRRHGQSRMAGVLDQLPSPPQPSLVSALRHGNSREFVAWLRNSTRSNSTASASSANRLSQGSRQSIHSLHSDTAVTNPHVASAAALSSAAFATEHIKAQLSRSHRTSFRGDFGAATVRAAGPTGAGGTPSISRRGRSSGPEHGSPGLAAQSLAPYARGGFSTSPQGRGSNGSPSAEAAGRSPMLMPLPPAGSKVSPMRSAATSMRFAGPNAMFAHSAPLPPARSPPATGRTWEKHVHGTSPVGPSRGALSRTMSIGLGQQAPRSLAPASMRFTGPNAMFTHTHDAEPEAAAAAAGGGGSPHAPYEAPALPTTRTSSAPKLARAMSIGLGQPAPRSIAAASMRFTGPNAMFSHPPARAAFDRSAGLGAFSEEGHEAGDGELESDVAAYAPPRPAPPLARVVSVGLGQPLPRSLAASSMRFTGPNAMFSHERHDQQL